MVRKLKKIVSAVLLLILGCAVWDGASVLYSLSWLTQRPLSAPYTPQKGNELAPLLGQNFFFLDQGSTSEVFLSEDRTTILKVFLDKDYTSHKKKHLPLLNRLASLKKTLRMKRLKYGACINAYGLLKQETALLYYHFSPTPFFKQTLTLVGKEGEKRTLDLDRDCYIVQKKAEVVGEYLHRCGRRGETEKGKRGITDLLTFTHFLYEQGIVLVDLQFISNFGFIEGVPVRIDVEHLAFKPSWKTSYRPHLEEQLKDFRCWLKEACPPSFVDHFDKEVTRLFSQNIS